MSDIPDVPWDELRNVVQHYPVWPGDTVSHGTMRKLCALGLAVRDKSGCWIPTAAAVRLYLSVQSAVSP